MDIQRLSKAGEYGFDGEGRGGHLGNKYANNMHLLLWVDKSDRATGLKLQLF